MAERAGLSVPEFRLEKILNRNLLLLKRFDRRGQEVRIPFLSAMSMLGASDGDHGSYLDLGEILRDNFVLCPRNFPGILKDLTTLVQKILTGSRYV